MNKNELIEGLKEAMSYTEVLVRCANCKMCKSSGNMGGGTDFTCTLNPSAYFDVKPDARCTYHEPK